MSNPCTHTHRESRPEENDREHGPAILVKESVLVRPSIVCHIGDAPCVPISIQVELTSCNEVGTSITTLALHCYSRLRRGIGCAKDVGWDATRQTRRLEDNPAELIGDPEAIVGLRCHCR